MRRVSPSMVVALIALFVALSGSAYAVTALPRNSVGPSQLKANAVTAAKIRAGAVTETKIGPGAVSSSRIKDGTIATEDLAAATRAALAGATGATGATGAQGPAGPTASAALSETDGATLPTSFAVETSLLAPFSGTSTGPLVLTRTMRVTAIGNVYVFKTALNATSRATVTCRLQYRETSSPSPDYTALGYETEVTLPAVAAGGLVRDNLPLLGWATLGAGTYDVRVECMRQADGLLGGSPASTGHTELSIIAAAS